eukprot:Blabericola_migrator_1__8309@NODE_4314_length_1222_cov_38_099567_g2667_i0_p1_GENE_NODE_4314_length_1222_cov_38_099567_g2667_i0NODE_4314_length_1222_cov_38_099567_g2667_i0_p1_ORF_typecomplete_len127_score7_55CLN6/PF15156_6/0_12_NODE_4314_length_1222_cov_38_099567_g2667_i0511891
MNINVYIRRSPDAAELAQLGVDEERVDRLTPSHIEVERSKFLDYMNQGVKASLSVYTHLLVQRIRQKLENDNIVDSFENLCALAEVSSLAHNMWALCVSETKSLWKIYGRAWKCKGTFTSLLPPIY